MAKLELKNIFNENLDSILFISGGPGLSPISFEVLAQELEGLFNIYFYYPSGTYKDEPSGPFDYETQLEELLGELKKISPVHLVGHSFGGIQAVDVATRNPAFIKSLICLSSPFKADTFKYLGKVFNQEKSDEQKEMDKSLSADPTDKKYSEWFASYASLYFASFNREKGRQMLLDDTVSVRSYLEARSESSKKEHLINEIKNIKIKKLFIGGANDILLPPNVLRKDSEIGDFVFKEVKDAGHFVHFDQPKMTASLIKELILSQEEEE